MVCNDVMRGLANIVIEIDFKNRNDVQIPNRMVHSYNAVCGGFFITTNAIHRKRKSADIEASLLHYVLKFSCDIIELFGLLGAQNGAQPHEDF